MSQIRIGRRCSLCSYCRTGSQEAMNVLGIEPKYNDSEMKDLSKQTPNVVGKSLDEAKKTLEENNLNFVVVGDDSTVTRQCPSGADTIPNGGTVYLYTDDSEKQTVNVPNFKGLPLTRLRTLPQAVILIFKSQVTVCQAELLWHTGKVKKRRQR